MSAQNRAFATGTSPVTASPDDVSPFGVRNLVGNVDEIIRDDRARWAPRHDYKGAHSEANGDVWAAPFECFLVDEGVSGKLTGFRCVIEDHYRRPCGRKNSGEHGPCTQTLPTAARMISTSSLSSLS